MKRLKIAWQAFCNPKLFENGIRDSLTGALNRKTFIKAANCELVRAERKNRPATLVFIDLDNFKRLNDKRGHKAGDLLLKSFSQLIMKSIRPYDLFSRWGGDEFVLFFPETTVGEAKQIVGRIYKTCPHFSWGVSPSDKKLEEMIEKADARMYWAKKLKRIVEIKRKK
jgi:diguanylate cyclase (GGDEF)-like protein